MTLVHRIDGPGDADALVLSSPIGTNLDVWRPALPTLERGYRVVRYDHPDGAAHFAHVERPEAFTHAVLEHLAQEVAA